MGSIFLKISDPAISPVSMPVCFGRTAPGPGGVLVSARQKWDTFMDLCTRTM